MTYDSQFFVLATTALERTLGRRSASADLVYTQSEVNGRRRHAMTGTASGRPLTVRGTGPSSNFVVTAQPLTVYVGSDCSGHYVVVSISKIKHAHGLVSRKTVEAMSHRIFAVVREAFIKAEGTAENFWGLGPEMFVRPIVEVIFKSDAASSG